MKEPHTALFVAPTGVGKTHLALNLLESEYRNHFDFIIIICPTVTSKMAHKFLLYIRLKVFMKEPHTALFVAPTGVGKTHLALNLLESEYRNHFDFIIIICPTVAHNKTYKS